MASKPWTPTHTGAEADYPAYDGTPRLSYLICSTPRSGSSLFCRLLEGSGRMGRPMEYLNPDVQMPLYARRLGAMVDGRIDPGRYLDALTRIRTSPEGVLGIKVHYDQLVRLVAHPRITRLVAESRLLRIRRRDRLAQAISLYKSWVTGQWGRRPGDEPAPVAYDRKGIAKALTAILSGEQGWDALFVTTGLPHREVWYEDLLADTHGVCQAAYHWVHGEDWSGTFSLAMSPSLKQADATSAEWKARFQAESRRERGLDQPPA